MGKYNKFQSKRPEAPYKIHPAWTGIGCLMIVIVPIMSWAASVELIKLGKAQGWPLMRQLGGYVRLPEALYTTPILDRVANYISSIPDFSALVLFFLIILLVLSGILSLGYATVYRMIGPPRYTSEDAPAPRVKTKRYTR
jgi:hypothetical protein